MGQLHNELRRTQLNKALKAAIGDSKSEGGLERYGETLQPVLDLWRQPEWGWLRQETLWSKSNFVAAVVGEFGLIGIANPAGSGRLVMVDRATARTAAAAAVILGQTTQALLAATATFSTIAVRDLRKPGPLTVSVPEFWFGSDPAALISGPGTMDEIVSGVAQEYRVFEVGLPAIIPPGLAVVFQTGTTNAAFGVTVGGRVRVLLPGEL